MHDSFFRLVSGPGRPGGAGWPGARLRCGVRPTHALVHTEQVVNLEWGPNLGWLYRHEPSLLNSTPSPPPLSPPWAPLTTSSSSRRTTRFWARSSERPQHLCFRWTHRILGSDISISWCSGSKDQRPFEPGLRANGQRRMTAPNAVRGIRSLFSARGSGSWSLVAVFRGKNESLMQIESSFPT